MANRRFELKVVLLLAALLVLASPTGALAGCHSFDVEVSEGSPDEGDTITVTVSRDGSAADSGVRLTALNGTARAGSDFTALDQQVNFTGNTTERSFQIGIVEDGTAEPAETFNVRLTQPTGCSVNPNFDLPEPVTVRIGASEGSGAPPAPPPPPPARPAASPTPTEEPTPEATETATPTPSPIPTPTNDDADDGGGISPQMIIGLLALAGAVGVGAWLYNEHRKPPPAI